MANDLESAVWDALKTVKFPGMSRDIVSFGFVHQVSANAGAVVVDLQMSTHNPAAGEKVRVYVPYGTQWYGYLMRRLAERPANVAFFARAVTSRR